jgi:HAD superfamily hydrolase (TIGR01509 family)
MSEFANMLVSKKCFVWDFDGCLCDSENAHYRAYNKAFQCFGHSIKESEYYASFTHLGNGTEREIAKYNVACSASEIAVLKNSAYHELIVNNEIPLFREIPEIIKRMKAHGAKVAIASNSPIEELQGILSHTDIFGDFDLIVGRTPELRKKPFPDLFLRAISGLGVSSSEVLIFEDADKGLEAAFAAHCDTVWMRTRYNATLSTSFPIVASLTHHQLLEQVRQAFASARLLKNQCDVAN